MGNTETMFDRNSYQRFSIRKEEIAIETQLKNVNNLDKKVSNSTTNSLSSIRIKEFEAGICLIR